MVQVLYKGRKRLVHIGKNGGKYVIVEGTKRYLRPKTKPVKKKTTKTKTTKGKKLTKKKTTKGKKKMKGGRWRDFANLHSQEVYVDKNPGETNEDYEQRSELIKRARLKIRTIYSDDLYFYLRKLIDCAYNSNVFSNKEKIIKDTFETDEKYKARLEASVEHLLPKYKYTSDMLPIEKSAIQTLGYTNAQWNTEYNNNNRSIEYKPFNKLKNVELEAARTLGYTEDEDIPFYIGNKRNN